MMSKNWMIMLSSWTKGWRRSRRRMRITISIWSMHIRKQEVLIRIS